MNKKIKIIELFVKIANEEEMPKKLKFDNIIWIYNPDKYDYIDTGNDIKLFAEIIVFSKGWLNQEVEILEDNTEEIEEKSNFENMGYEIAQAYFEFYKGIAKALTEKRKESEDKQ